MTQETPQAHARLSPSGSKRWRACPGSLALTAGHPDLPNVYSEEGTAIHEVSAICLKRADGTRAHTFIGSWIVVSPDGVVPQRKVCFTEEMADLAQGYIEFVEAKSKGYDLRVEQKLEFSKFVGVPGQFGTTDAGFVDWEHGEIVIDDLKSGHRHVDVTRNPQLMIYALAFLGQLYEDYRAAVERGEIPDDTTAYRKGRVIAAYPAGIHANRTATKAATAGDLGDDFY